MATSNVQPARGTRDFLPGEVRRREHVIRVVREVYEQYGYEPLETPAFENIETLLGKYGEEGNKLIFKILRRGEHEARGEADLALRYDLTVPLARVVAQYPGEIPRLFKRYQIQPVWRADRPARGRFREFYQCDIDAVGSGSPLVEVEQMAAVGDVLRRLGFVEFTILLNHRGILTALLGGAGVPDAQHESALVALDKLDKVGVAGVARELEVRGIDARATKALLGVFESAHGASPEETLRRLEASVPPDQPAFVNLAEIVSLVQSSSLAGHVRVALNLARGLSYYTGAIMELAVPDLPVSLGAGGRYDHLIGMFLGRDIAACGFSLGFERIVVVMAERKMFPDSVEQGAADVMVALWNAAAASDALALAGELRRGGLRVDTYPEPDKLGKQVKYAAGRHVPFVAIVGDEERARGEVAVKDLRSGVQTTVPRRDAAALMKSRLHG